ncbi:MAG: thiamine diphosphokinase [Fidelibacterota bacterium]
MNRKRILVLANGAFPSHPRPLALLSSQHPILCTDGAVAGLLNHGLAPDYVIGDMDSIPTCIPDSVNQIPIPDQHDTDYEKALRWCADQGFTDVTILGISGGREDHHLVNLLALLNWGDRLTIRGVTDTATIWPVHDIYSLSVAVGQTISLIAPVPETRITTNGLQWDLSHQPLPSYTGGISNRTIRERITVKVTHPVLLFLIHPDIPV